MQVLCFKLPLTQEAHFHTADLHSHQMLVLSDITLADHHRVPAMEHMGQQLAGLVVAANPVVAVEYLSHIGAN